jgi:anti-sigma factor RsiW
MATEPVSPIGEDDLHALVDGQIDSTRLPAVERYLAERPDEAARVQAFMGQRDALRAALAFKADEPIPARLRVANLRAGRRRAVVARWRMAAAAAVLLMVGGGIGWSLRGSLQPEPSMAAAEPAVIHRQFAEGPAPRMQALTRDTDIAAWLLPRLGEPLSPPDLSNFGFALEAAWVLPGSDGAAAMLLYVDLDGTALSIWRRPTRDPVPRQLRCADEPGGLLTYSWSDGHRLHAVTAAMTRDRLRPIAQAVERDLEAPPARSGLIAGLVRRPCDTSLG